MKVGRKTIVFPALPKIGPSMRISSMTWTEKLGPQLSGSLLKTGSVRRRKQATAA